MGGGRLRGRGSFLGGGGGGIYFYRSYKLTLMFRQVHTKILDLFTLLEFVDEVFVQFTFIIFQRKCDYA